MIVRPLNMSCWAFATTGRAAANPAMPASIAVQARCSIFILPYLFLALRSDRGVQSQQVGDRLRRPPAEAAFGRDTEIADVMLSRRHAAPCTVRAVLQMDQAEIERRLRAKFQPGKRSEIGLVVPFDRHRQMNPV